VEQWDSISAAEAEASVDIHPLELRLLHQPVQLKTTFEINYTENDILCDSIL